MSNEFQNRLKNYEATPSDKVWPAIEEALDEQKQPHFQKLFDYEQEPNADIWNMIESCLDEESTKASNVFPLKKKNKNRFAYLMAAAVLLLVVVGITYLATNKSSKELAVNQQKTDSATPSGTIKNSQKNSEANSLMSPQEKNNAALKQAIEEGKTENTVALNTAKITANRYTTMENEKGKVVRLSKKVIPVFDCADNLNANNNSSCKENIQNLQHKMATSFISTSADFGGLIDMLKDLKENSN